MGCAASPMSSRQPLLNVGIGSRYNSGHRVMLVAFLCLLSNCIEGNIGRLPDNLQNIRVKVVKVGEHVLDFSRTMPVWSLLVGQLKRRRGFLPSRSWSPVSLSSCTATKFWIELLLIVSTVQERYVDSPTRHKDTKPGVACVPRRRIFSSNRPQVLWCHLQAGKLYQDPLVAPQQLTRTERQPSL